MSPEVLLSKVCDFPPPIDSSREVLTPESRLSQLETEDPLDGNPEAESISPRSDQTEHWLLYHKQRRTALRSSVVWTCLGKSTFSLGLRCPRRLTLSMILRKSECG